MTEWIFEILGLLGSWGYLIIFLAAFLESSAFLGLLVPGESTVVIAGVLSSQGYLDLWDSIAVISLGAAAGDTAGYALGRVLGRGYFERHGRLFFIKARHIAMADEYFIAHGGKTIFFGRFVGFLRAMAPFAAGVSKMPYGRFFAYNVSGAVLWALSFTLLGYFFGLSWKSVESWAGRAGLFAFFIVLVFAGFVYLYRKLIKRQADIKAWFLENYARIRDSRTLKSFTAKHPGISAFVTERLSPTHYLGVHLTAGLLLSVFFILLLAKIVDDVVSGEPLVTVDQLALSAVEHFRTPFVAAFMQAVEHLGASFEIAAATFVVAAYLLVFKSKGRYAAALLAGVAGGVALGAVVRAVFHRLLGAAPAARAAYALPSSQALVSVVFYGLGAYFIVRRVRSWRLQVAVSLLAIFIVLISGLARIYSGHALVTETLAGYAGGLLWLTVCVTGLEIYSKIAERRHY